MSVKEKLQKQAVDFLDCELDPEIIKILCDAVCRKLDDLLADGLTCEDCAEAYQAAGLWIVIGWTREIMNWRGIVSLSAGDIQARFSTDTTPLQNRALSLMSPYMKDRGFVFRGVRG